VTRTWLEERELLLQCKASPHRRFGMSRCCLAAQMNVAGSSMKPTVRYTVGYSRNEGTYLEKTQCPTF
jgi:hypothetical protein